MATSTGSTRTNARENGAPTLPTLPESAEGNQKEGDNNNERSEERQHGNDRGREDDIEDIEGSGGENDEDTRSQDSMRRHQDSGETPAPKNDNASKRHAPTTIPFNIPTSYYPPKSKESKSPVVNYRTKVMGPDGDISITCGCETKHLKACTTPYNCRCRWAKRFHTTECNLQYTNAMEAAQQSTSEDEDEEPDPRYETPGKKQPSPRTDKQSPPITAPTKGEAPKSSKRKREGESGAIPASYGQKDGRRNTEEQQRTDGAGSSSETVQILRILKGTIKEIKEDRKEKKTSRSKDRWKDVAVDIQQVTPANEKDLKTVAQLYQKAEGEGKTLAEDDYSRIVEQKGSSNIKRHQSDFIMRKGEKKHSLKTHREIARDYMASKFSASAVGVAIRSWYADCPSGTTTSEAFALATEVKKLAEWMTIIQLQGAGDYQEHTHAEAWLEQFPELARSINLTMNMRYGKGEWTILGLEEVLKNHWHWEGYSKGPPTQPQKRLANMTVYPPNESTETAVLRQLMLNRDEELAKKEEEHTSMQNVIDELLEENKRVREHKSTAGTSPPIATVQQHVTTTSTTSTTNRTADTREHGRAKQHDYKYDNRYEGEWPREGAREYERQRWDEQQRTQRPENYGNDSRTRREPYSSREREGNDRRRDYGNQQGQQARSHTGKGGKGSRNQGQVDRPRNDRGDGVPCMRHFGRNRECTEPHCPRSHAQEDRDECFHYRRSGTCNTITCTFKHTPYRNQPARVINAAVQPQAVQPQLQYNQQMQVSPQPLQLVPPQGGMQLQLPYYPQTPLNNDPGPPPGLPFNAIVPLVPPVRGQGNCNFFKKGTCTIKDCKLRHAL